MDVLWGAVAAVIGAAIGFFADIAKTGLSEKAERRRAIKERSDNAASDLVVLLDDAREHFSDSDRRGSGVDHQRLRVTLGAIRQKAILVGDPEVRVQIEAAVRVFSGYRGIHQATGDAIGIILYRAWDEARETLARMLNDQAFVESKVLEEFATIAKDHYSRGRVPADEMRSRLPTRDPEY